MTNYSIYYYWLAILVWFFFFFQYFFSSIIKNVYLDLLLKMQYESQCFYPKNSELRFFFILPLGYRIGTKHKSNNYNVQIGVWETYVKSKIKVAGTDATKRLEHMTQPLGWEHSPSIQYIVYKICTDVLGRLIRYLMGGVDDYEKKLSTNLLIKKTHISIHPQTKFCSQLAWTLPNMVNVTCTKICFTEKNVHKWLHNVFYYWAHPVHKSNESSINCVLIFLTHTQWLFWFTQRTW